MYKAFSWGGCQADKSRQALQMRNHGLPQTREGETFWVAAAAASPSTRSAAGHLPQASPNSSAFPAGVSPAVYPAHWTLCLGRATYLGYAGQGAAPSVGRSPRDLPEHPWAARGGLGWESPSLAATNADFLAPPKRATSVFLLLLFSCLEVMPRQW